MSGAYAPDTVDKDASGPSATRGPATASTGAGESNQQGSADKRAVSTQGAAKSRYVNQRRQAMLVLLPPDVRDPSYK